MDKRLFIQVQGGRKVSGILRGYDIFLNIVLDEATEETNPAQKNQIGQVVSAHSMVGFRVADLVFLGGVNRSYEETVCSLWSHSRRLDKKTRKRAASDVLPFFRRVLFLQLWYQLFVKCLRINHLATNPGRV